MNFPILLTGLLLFAPNAQDEPKEPEDTFQAPADWKPLGQALWFDQKNRRLILRAQVVLQEGWLEHLLCLHYTKEHESILSTKAIPQLIHAGLLLTGAEPGQPVQFRPEFQPPSGTSLNIQLEWEQAGQTKTADARTWVRDEETGKILPQRWVFVGSMKYQDPQTGEELYAADGGDLITVANFSSAIIDVPFASSAEDTARGFVANTPQIPPLGTFVTMYLSHGAEAEAEAEAEAKPTEAKTEAKPTP